MSFCTPSKTTANDNLTNSIRIDALELHDAFDIKTLVCYELVSPNLVKIAVFTPITRPNESDNGSLAK